ncbi:unnamed protein product [Paramecium sonneborni]|uniref:Uncharacterized protein n=1 Tax=Paramecium sonneborni TaxID=65129 RepID=A0A8S1R432_9CILI|nr:unnamed protein product [Paramecium sonneborni]
MNNKQQNPQCQESIPQSKSNQQNQKSESLKLKQPQHDYSKGNRTCMATGKNGIDFYILAKIVQKEHSETIQAAIEDLF